MDHIQATHPDPSATGIKPLGQPPRILVVEDEQDIGGLIKHALERDGHMHVDLVGTGDAALKAVVDDPPDLIILDLNLPVLKSAGVRTREAVRAEAIEAVKNHQTTLAQQLDLSK